MMTFFNSVRIMNYQKQYINIDKETNIKIFEEQIFF